MTRARKTGGAPSSGDAGPVPAGKNLPADARMLFANPRNDITIPHYSRTLRPTDAVLTQRGGNRGVDLYREVLRDGRCYTVLQKRKRALIARKWEVVPASDAAVDRRAAEVVERQLARLSFDNLTLSLLDATLMGFSTVEVVWDRDGSEIYPRKAKKLDQRRIAFDAEWRPRLLTRESMVDGLEFPDRKIVTHRFDEDDSSDPYGFGLGRILFWHCLFKREGVSFWLKALERYAVPLPVAKYPMGMLAADQNRLIDALSGAISSGALAVPSGTDVEFAQAMLSGTVTHEGWCRYWDEQSAEAVLGETLTTNVGANGSRAAAETHKDVKDELIDGDGDLVAATLRESLVRWIVEYNVPDAQVPEVARPRSSNLTAEETAALKRAERQSAEVATIFLLMGKGYAPADVPARLTEVMGTPIVAAPALTDASTDTSGGDQGAEAAFAEVVGRLKLGEGTAGLADALLRATEPIRRDWVAAIGRVAAEAVAAGGDADLGEMLDRLLPALDTAEMTELLAEAMLLADLKGRAEVSGEAG